MSLADLDSLLAGAPSHDGVAGDGPLTSAAQLLTPLLPVPLAAAPVASVVRWAEEELYCSDVLAGTDQLDELIRNYVKFWKRTVGSGKSGDLLKTTWVVTSAIYGEPERFADAFQEAFVTGFSSQIIDTWSTWPASRAGRWR